MLAEKLIAALTSGSGDEPLVSAAIPGGEAAGNAMLSRAGEREKNRDWL